jgi:threonine dehydratase
MMIPLVRACVPPTPQYAWPLLEAQTGVQVVVKHEMFILSGLSANVRRSRA